MARRDLTEEERVQESLINILSRLSENEIVKLFDEDNMPNDQNYVWSEEDVLQDTKIFNFKKIKGIIFSGP